MKGEGLNWLFRNSPYKLILPFILIFQLTNSTTANDKTFPEHQTVSSSHFKLHHESSYAPAGVLNVLEGLHAKLLLDLHAFAPWASQDKVEVFLFKDAASYAAHTGMPKWAGAHVNLNTRQVYGYESERFQRAMAHEMAHLFFDSYFLVKKKHPPLWLNEGVATLMEYEYGAEYEKAGIERMVANGPVMPLNQFFAYQYRHSGPQNSKQVAHWYAQSYSVIKFLMRRFSNAQFVTFCEKIRSGAPIDDALSAAYGLQMNNTKSLEKLWREGIGK